MKSIEYNQLLIPETSSIRAIRYLTLQGGGMKGIGYIGVVKSLAVTGVLAQLEEVAGTSVGAIVATLIAIGCTSEEIESEMQALDFKKFQDAEYSSWIETFNLMHTPSSDDIISSTDHKIDLIEQSLKKENSTPSQNGLSGLFNDGTLDMVEKLADIYFNLGLWEGNAFTNWLLDIVARKTGNPNITFKELATLSKQLLSPYKQLTLTGSNITDKKLEYYSVHETPDMSIVDAVRISASFPGAFKPVIRQEKNGQKVFLVDGGLLENLPDIFNKPPYIKIENISKKFANKEALAIVFKDTHEPQNTSIKNGLDLVKAMYSTKANEKLIQEKYGQNIAYIDPVGVGTLEFNASYQKRTRLAYSGAKGVIKAFEKIVQAENNNDSFIYSTLGIKELIRQKVSYQMTLKQQTNENALLLNKITLLNDEIEKRKIRKNTIDRLNLKFQESIIQRKKKTNNVPLTDEELIKLCQDGISLHKRTEQELHKKTQQLSLAKEALIMEREELLSQFGLYDTKNYFNHYLQKLKNLQDRIFFNRKENAKTEQGNLNESIKKNFNIRTTDITMVYQNMVLKREQLFKEIEMRYDKKSAFADPLLSKFFKNLHHRCITRLDFKIPNTHQGLKNYCQVDINACIKLIKEAKYKNQKKLNEQKIFTQYQKIFSERTLRSSKYSELLKFKNELDFNIRRKTTVLTKLNHYLLKKSTLFRSVVKRFLKLASFTSFVCALPFAIPIVTIAKMVKHFSRNEKTQTSAQRFINFFKYTDIDYDTKLRKFQKITAHLLQVMKKNYVEDKSEFSYLQKLFSEHLKNSGFELTSLLEKNNDETSEAYNKRISRIKQHLEELIPGSNLGNKTKQVKENSDIKAEGSINLLKKKLEITHTRMIHAEFVRNIENKINANKLLSKLEIKEYISSVKLLNVTLAKKFIQNYSHLAEGSFTPSLIKEKKYKDKNSKKYLKDNKDNNALDFFYKEKNHLNFHKHILSNKKKT